MSLPSVAGSGELNLAMRPFRTGSQRGSYAAVRAPADLAADVRASARLKAVATAPEPLSGAAEAQPEAATDAFCAELRRPRRQRQICCAVPASTELEPDPAETMDGGRAALDTDPEVQPAPLPKAVELRTPRPGVMRVILVSAMVLLVATAVGLAVGGAGQRERNEPRQPQVATPPEASATPVTRAEPAVDPAPSTAVMPAAPAPEAPPATPTPLEEPVDEAVELASPPRAEGTTLIPEPPPAALPAPTPCAQVVELRTEPPRATVVEGRYILGRTPMLVRVKPGAPRTFVLSRHGHDVRIVTLDTDAPDELIVSLAAK